MKLKASIKLISTGSVKNDGDLVRDLTYKDEGIYIVSDNNFRHEDYLKTDMYIVLDEEAQPGDCAFDTEEVGKSHPVIKILGNTNMIMESMGSKRFLKIVASTDKSLPVLSIGHGFLNRFITDPSRFEEIYVSVGDNFDLDNYYFTTNEGGILISEIKKEFSRSDMIDFSKWMKHTEFNIHGHSPEDCFNQYLDTL